MLELSLKALLEETISWKRIEAEGRRTRWYRVKRLYIEEVEARRNLES